MQQICDMESDTSLDLVWLCPSFSTLYIEEPVAALERWTSVQTAYSENFRWSFYAGSIQDRFHYNNSSQEQ